MEASALNKAVGRPVIALGAGGVLETVIEGETGCFFVEQSVESLMKAVERFESDGGGITAAACRRNAERFSREKFRAAFTGALQGFGLGGFLPNK